jgi:predicted transcriptional regulator
MIEQTMTDAMSFLTRKLQRQVDVHDQIALGPLESEVMEILWTRGRSNVRDVVQDLCRPLAYTTVMTTLDRLFKKGMLAREKADRAFFYFPALSREQWEQIRAGRWVSGFLSGPKTSGELLISYLVDAVEKHDETLLEELERQISIKRRELESRGRE